ncbi:MAG: hypothetical protein Q4G05_06100 [Clostridia bacterium]|nr:hypothetical protein [Clostridia bacterium]
MIGYKVNLPNDNSKKKNFEASLKLIHEFHPGIQGSKEKRRENAANFYSASLQKSEGKAITMRELQKIQEIRKNIEAWS